jgi:hypothetical protein
MLMAIYHTVIHNRTRSINSYSLPNTIRMIKSGTSVEHVACKTREIYTKFQYKDLNKISLGQQKSKLKNITNWS